MFIQKSVGAFARVERLRLDLDEFDMRAVFDKNVHTAEEILIFHRCLENDDFVPLEQLVGLGERLLVIEGLDLDAIRVITLGERADLEAAVRQRREERILLLLVGVFLFAGVEELGQALLRQLEAGFGQVAWGHTIAPKYIIFSIKLNILFLYLLLFIEFLLKFRNKFSDKGADIFRFVFFVDKYPKQFS